MRANRLSIILSAILLSVVIATCGSSQKPFDQMTAQEHRQAAAREHQLADENFAKVRGENITPPETLPTGDVYDWAYAESGGAIDYTYEAPNPIAYTAWPRVGDPSEKYEDAASKHREQALRHERAAAALEAQQQGSAPQPAIPIDPDRG